MRVRFNRRSLGLALALAGLPSAAAAGTANGNLAVSATVIASCVVSTSPLAFGNYDPVSSTALDAATTIDVTCTNGTDYDVLMDEGDGAGATVNARQMTGATSLLTYTIYSDAGRSNVWGQTIGANVVQGTGTGAAQSIDVYGRIPVNQTAEAGAMAHRVCAAQWRPGHSQYRMRQC